MTLRDIERVLYFEAFVVTHPGMTPLARAQLLTEDDYIAKMEQYGGCLLYTSPSPRDRTRYRMPSSALKKKKKTTHIAHLQSTSDTRSESDIKQP